jgi:hypothetical protein
VVPKPSGRINVSVIRVTQLPTPPRSWCGAGGGPADMKPSPATAGAETWESMPGEHGPSPGRDAGRSRGAAGAACRFTAQADGATAAASPSSPAPVDADAAKERTSPGTEARGGLRAAGAVSNQAPPKAAVKTLRRRRAVLSASAGRTQASLSCARWERLAAILSSRTPTGLPCEHSASIAANPQGGHSPLAPLRACVRSTNAQHLTAILHSLSAACRPYPYLRRTHVAMDVELLLSLWRVPPCPPSPPSHVRCKISHTPETRAAVEGAGRLAASRYSYDIRSGPARPPVPSCAPCQSVG